MANKYGEVDHYTSYSVKYPDETLRIVKELSRDTGIYASELIRIALDNEITQEPEGRFYYDVTLPDVSDYEEIEEKHQVIMKAIEYYLAKVPTGSDLSSMCLSRRDIGYASVDTSEANRVLFDSKDDFLVAMALLMELGTVEAVKRKTRSDVYKIAGMGPQHRVKGLKEVSIKEAME